MSSRLAILGFSFLCLVVFSGCAAMDAVFGVGSGGGATGGEGGGAPIDILGALLNTVLPGAAGAAALARWIYTEVRQRKIDKSFKTCVKGVTDAVDEAKDGKLKKERLYDLITAASDFYKNRDFFVEAVGKIKDEVRSKRDGNG